MAGQEFGHHLGLPRALSGLPLSPLVPGYGTLAAAQHAAGLRHLGEVLGPAPVGLRVLDGLYVPSGPRGRRRVDGLFLDSLAQGAGPAAALAARMAALHRSDPQALRRVVLYQLIGLLQDRPAAQHARFAAELGVHADEVAGLAAAARLRPALDRRGRDAAESLAEAWERRRLHRLRGLLDRLPPDGGDPALTSLRTALAERLGVVEDALRSARRAEEHGDREAATSAYLTALGEAADDRRALGGLVRVHRPGSGRRPLLTAELRPDHVELSWQDPDGSASDWRLLRLCRTKHGRPAVRSVSGADPTSAGTVRDKEAALGSTVRYAALPLRDGRVAGPPLVSRRLLVAPEVGRPALTDGPGRIEGTWQRPAGADEVTVERTGDTGRLSTHADGFTVTGLPAGSHAFRVVCHYRAPDGSRVRSPGVPLTGTVHPWPQPVHTLTAQPEGGAVQFAWTGGQGAEVRLAVWPGQAPVPGTELRTEELPPPLDWPRQADALRPPPGTYAEVTAVAVRGARALAGPTVGVEVVRPVPGLAAHRLPDGQAQVTLDWPEGAGQLAVTWDAPDGETAAGERTLTAHAYRRGGLRLPVGPGAVRIRAATVPRVPGAVVVVPDAAETLLPPDAAVSYHLVRPSRRFLGRGRTMLRVTLSASGALGDVPEFVCVARSGTLRPRSAADGTTVLRIPGSDLARHGTVEQELPASPCPAPYTLRGFLLGEHAALVRLEEPSLASLVVR